eukprot:2542572-Pyramimonas_sp.AAC.1
MAPFPRCLDDVAGKLDVAMAARIQVAFARPASTIGQLNDVQKVIAEASLVWGDSAEFVEYQCL